MSEFPPVEADELVTKQFLRAELAELRMEVHGQTVRLGSGLVAATALLATLGVLT